MGSWRTGKGCPVAFEERYIEWGAKGEVTGVLVLSGQVRMRSIWDKYYADAHGVIFVVDAADVARFEEAKLAFCG